ncbi:MAG: CvpA family protein [Alphaproteobacteria bacterium]
MEHTTELAQQAHATNWIDIGVLALLLISGIFAMMRGFVKEAFVLIGWVGAMYASMHLFPTVQPWMREQFKNKMTADAVAYFSIFIATLIILLPITSFIISKIQGTALTAIDRSLGFVFGVLRGLLIASLIFLMAQQFWEKPEEAPKAVQEAKTLPLLEAGAQIIKDMIPESKRKDGVESEKDERVDKAEQFLKNLTTPTPELNKTQPAYDKKEQKKLDELIEQKSRP